MLGVRMTILLPPSRTQPVTCQLPPYSLPLRPAGAILDIVLPRPFMDFLRIYTIALGVAAVALAAVGLSRRKKRTSRDLELERRQFLDRIGRITDGNVLDVQEAPASGDRVSQLIIFQYEIAGVEYQCSQDVTYLRQWINLHSCRLGLPTSVKYDPQNPGNSMVISERWIGLR